VRKLIAIGFALMIPATGAMADDVGGDTVIQIQQEEIIMEEPVTAPPPPYVELESRAIAAGIGARIGNGVLLMNGQEHPFKVTGVSLGDFGFSRIVGEGPVANLDSIEDFAGRYVALEAGIAAGKGVSTLTMRNEKGITITLDSALTGAQLTLGAQGLVIELQ
jgi:hypothetical protein